MLPEELKRASVADVTVEEIMGGGIRHAFPQPNVNQVLEMAVGVSKDHQFPIPGGLDSLHRFSARNSSRLCRAMCKSKPHGMLS